MSPGQTAVVRLAVWLLLLLLFGVSLFVYLVGWLVGVLCVCVCFCLFVCLLLFFVVFFVCFFLGGRDYCSLVLVSIGSSLWNRLQLCGSSRSVVQARDKPMDLFKRNIQEVRSPR